MEFLLLLPFYYFFIKIMNIKSIIAIQPQIGIPSVPDCWLGWVIKKVLKATAIEPIIQAKGASQPFLFILFINIFLFIFLVCILNLRLCLLLSISKIRWLIFAMLIQVNLKSLKRMDSKNTK